MAGKVVKLTNEAYQFLKQRSEELDVSMKDVASQLITNAQDAEGDDWSWLLVALLALAQYPKQRKLIIKAIIPLLF